MRPRTYAPDSRNANPGPGAYDMLYKDPHGPKYSLRTKSNIGGRNEGPGPGAYDGEYTTVKEKAPYWRIGTEARDKLTGFNEYPGPGQYKNERELNKRATSFPKEEGRTRSLSERAPGPGNYAHDGQFEDGIKKNKGKTFGLKTGQDRVNNVPAPNAYDPEVAPVRPTQARWGFGSSTRDDNHKNLNPAPCDYEINENPVHMAGPKWGMGSSAQRAEDITSAKANPGPGTYYPGLSSDSTPFFD